MKGRHVDGRIVDLPTSNCGSDYEDVLDRLLGVSMRTEWTPEQVSPTEPIVKGERGFAAPDALA